MKDSLRPLPADAGTGAARGRLRERGRKLWHRPRIVDRQHIEAMAADCGVPGGKADPTCLVPFS